MMGTVELSETEMLEVRYRSLDITTEPFMYHWTWSGGGYDITCTIRVVPPLPHVCAADSTSSPTKKMFVMPSKRDASFINQNSFLKRTNQNVRDQHKNAAMTLKFLRQYLSP